MADLGDAQLVGSTHAPLLLALDLAGCEQGIALVYLGVAGIAVVELAAAVSVIVQVHVTTVAQVGLKVLAGVCSISFEVLVTGFGRWLLMLSLQPFLALV